MHYIGCSCEKNERKCRQVDMDSHASWKWQRYNVLYIEHWVTTVMIFLWMIVTSVNYTWKSPWVPVFLGIPYTNCTILHWQNKRLKKQNKALNFYRNKCSTSNCLSVKMLFWQLSKPHPDHNQNQPNTIQQKLCLTWKWFYILYSLPTGLCFFKFKKWSI